MTMGRLTTRTITAGAGSKPGPLLMPTERFALAHSSKRTTLSRVAGQSADEAEMGWRACTAALRGVSTARVHPTPGSLGICIERRLCAPAWTPLHLPRSNSSYREKEALDHRAARDRAHRSQRARPRARPAINRGWPARTPPGAACRRSGGYERDRASQGRSRPPSARGGCAIPRADGAP